MLDLSHFPAIPASLSHIISNLEQGRRLTAEEAEQLARQAPMGLLSLLAVRAKESRSGKKVFYNRNFHIEPTNICEFNCEFCSYRRSADAPDAWDHSFDEIMAQVDNYKDVPITEVHIVGGVNPKYGLAYYLDLIRAIKTRRPEVSVKAFTAVELRYMIERAGLSVREGLQRLKDAGMAAIPGGGAEIFNPEIRRALCPDKGTAAQWLEVHRDAHQIGLTTNATMLYGHIENWSDRLDHLEHLRALQDETGGFNAFIPLKYRNRNNRLGKDVSEVSILEDMRVMAISRLFLDNIPHIKAYWPMFGQTTAQLALGYGADDMDGTIDDSTRIYTMAGSEEQNPNLSSDALETMIKQAGFTPVERDTFYNPVKKNVPLASNFTPYGFSERPCP